MLELDYIDVNDIKEIHEHHLINKLNKENSDFIQQQEAFLKSQQEIDEELAILEAKIDLLTQEEHKRGGRR